MIEPKTEWQIKLYKQGTLIATFSYPNQALQVQAALPIFKWFADDADEWRFIPQWAHSGGPTLN